MNTDLFQNTELELAERINASIDGEFRNNNGNYYVTFDDDDLPGGFIRLHCTDRSVMLLPQRVALHILRNFNEVNYISFVYYMSDFAYTVFTRASLRKAGYYV